MILSMDTVKCFNKIQQPDKNPKEHRYRGP